MEMIHLIPTMNKNLNKAIETKEGSGYTINELAKHVALNAAEIKKIGDSTSQIRTLIRANNALIKHVLTVSIVALFNFCVIFKTLYFNPSYELLNLISIPYSVCLYVLIIALFDLCPL